MVETSQHDEVSGVPQPGGRPVAGVSSKVTISHPATTMATVGHGTLERYGASRVPDREAQRRPLVVQARDDPLRRRTRANIRVSPFTWPWPSVLDRAATWIGKQRTPASTSVSTVGRSEELVTVELERLQETSVAHVLSLLGERASALRDPHTRALRSTTRTLRTTGSSRRWNWSSGSRSMSVGWSPRRSAWPSTRSASATPLCGSGQDCPRGRPPHPMPGADVSPAAWGSA